MSVYSPAYHTMVFSPSPVASKGAESVTVTADKSSGQEESFFHHILDVINPLQHLPVVGTIYRAITGEHIGTIEKIAGDTLYGGLWGAVSSVADVAFEAITGKSVEDTALAWLKGDDKPAVVAAKVTAPTITADASLPSDAMPDLPAPTAVAANSRPANMASNLTSNLPGNLPTSLPAGLDVAALTSALSAKGVDNETAGRALYAYRRSMVMGASQPVLASVN